MAKQLLVIYPGLKEAMEEANEGTEDLAKVLEMSTDSILRRLRNEVKLDIVEIVKLMIHYDKSFEELFGTEEEKAS